MNCTTLRSPAAPAMLMVSIKTNPVIDVFTGGDRLSHGGGAVVGYILFDPNGKSVSADTITQYPSYLKSGKVKRLKNPKLLSARPDDK